jgi:protein tyrosine/serine phosphatase
MKKCLVKIICLALLMPAICGCKDKTEETESVTRANVTPATKLELAGCGNLYKVSDALYRGEQPTAEGFKELEKLGIKTVVNLRSLHSDRDELEGTNLAYEHIRMEAWDPEQDEIEAFLTIVTDPDKQPVFVHCQHGADRTGTMVAVYRIVVEGWDVEKAVDEMHNGPFGFHEIFSGLPEFIEELDIETLRQKYAPVSN